MKKKMKIGLVVTMLMLATIVTVFGTELPVRVNVSGRKSVDLFFGKIEGKILVSISDKNGYLFHSKKLNNTEGYYLQYDMTSLPDGTYSLRLEHAGVIENVNIFIQDGLVSLDNGRLYILGGTK
jgi:hypothetical protein